jgi:hypothetical protein
MTDGAILQLAGRARVRVSRTRTTGHCRGDNGRAHQMAQMVAAVQLTDSGGFPGKSDDAVWERQQFKMNGQSPGLRAGRWPLRLGTASFRRCNKTNVP